MLTLLKNWYFKVEAIKGKKLLTLLIVSFTLCLLTGLLIGYFINRFLILNEPTSVDTFNQTLNNKIETSYTGQIRYIDPQMYPLDEINYALADKSGKEIVLLKAYDQKLTVVENLNVKVSGKLIKTKDGKKDILVVERVYVQNTAN